MDVGLPLIYAIIQNHNSFYSSLLRWDKSTRPIPFIDDSLGLPSFYYLKFRYSGLCIDAASVLLSYTIIPMKIPNYSRAVMKQAMTELVWFSG